MQYISAEKYLILWCYLKFAITSSSHALLNWFSFLNSWLHNLNVHDIYLRKIIRKTLSNFEIMCCCTCYNKLRRVGVIDTCQGWSRLWPGVIAHWLFIGYESSHNGQLTPEFAAFQKFIIDKSRVAGEYWKAWGARDALQLIGGEMKISNSPHQWPSCKTNSNIIIKCKQTICTRLHINDR